MMDIAPVTGSDQKELRRMATYEIDPQHSFVEFAVKHMKLSMARGRFRDLHGALHVDETAPANSWVDVTINAASIDTGVPERDDHLRSADFLNVSVFPQIRFRADKVELAGDKQWLVSGNLSLHGVTKSVVLEARFEGRMMDVDGFERIGFSAETRLNRRDFNINWSGWMSRYLIEDEIRVQIDLEAVKQSS